MSVGRRFVQHVRRNKVIIYFVHTDRTLPAGQRLDLGGPVDRATLVVFKTKNEWGQMRNCVH